ncbi:MAG: KH domain-containing protein [Candidatus Aureabacteria bacterium]|nr:KH domain-containing protein [Candidatus Auribacterota bacterium]
MKEFIEYVVKALVDRPEEVSVTQIDGEKTVIFELRCNESDIGKVIGKQGRTIKAIRTLLGSAAAKAGIRAMLEIIE